MKDNNKGITVLFLVIIAAFMLPWRNINWGKVNFTQETIVVTGESETKQKNEVASFSAGVNVIKENKEEAVEEVNKKINELMASVKAFGIPEADIQTQSINVYQQQKSLYSPSSAIRPVEEGQWVVNNTIEITLRDVLKVNDLVDLLNKSGANNVYGPSFRIEDTKEAEKTLYNDAIADAKEKAVLIAKASGRKLGKVVNVIEGSSSSYGFKAVPMSDSAAGGAELSPGTSTISKTLTVTFELK
jgi:hypothetical protein